MDEALTRAVVPTEAGLTAEDFSIAAAENSTAEVADTPAATVFVAGSQQHCGK
ncbi:MAG: hypothetical protein WBL63_02180 [Candidatus Acidiferrum sp.]